MCIAILFNLNSYKENSRLVIEATKKIANAVRGIPQLTLIGDPKVGH